ncbi:hypothetical protein GO986_12240 [Deinococcus sp. HMF7620]|uniref:ParB-like N-terminal domain-containing protein n=1 Tax=Deinococcus arboris TaxID=2682977 RepID=A0A7C9I002_9DEIO|nr:MULTISPECIES: hypothetical protein [Deinococcus]MBZ9752211.1 hypothetical protein [Deinococcus betulae]MVN87535.1 hypothetical protein [Deinococcus arboris]
MQPLFVQSGERHLCTVPLADIEPPPLRGTRNPIGPSVKEFGILTPLELYAAPPDCAFRYRVSAGTRRFHTAVAAGLETVPAFVSTDAQTAADITGIENLGRSNNPVAEALALREKLAQGYDLKAVARLWGAPQGTLKKRAKLLELPDWVLLAVGEQVAVSVVEALAAMREPYRTEAVEALQRKLADPSAQFTADDLKATRVAEEQDLSALLGTALLDAPAPLVQVNAAADLAARVQAMARNEGVALEDLLLALRPSPPVPEPEGVKTPLPSTLTVGGPPSRIRMNRPGAA